MQPLITFLLETGLRIGEALALTYADIDFEQKTVSVSKNVVFIEGKRIDQDTTKSAAGRNARSAEKTPRRRNRRRGICI